MRRSATPRLRADGPPPAPSGLPRSAAVGLPGSPAEPWAAVMRQAGLGCRIEAIASTPSTRRTTITSTSIAQTGRRGRARAEVTIGPDKYVEHAEWGYGSCPRTGMLHPQREVAACTHVAEAWSFTPATRTGSTSCTKPVSPSRPSTSSTRQRAPPTTPTTTSPPLPGAQQWPAEELWAARLPT